MTGRSLFPTGFDGEPGGVIYDDDELDHLLDELIGKVRADTGDHPAVMLADTISTFQHEPGVWARALPIILEVVAREEARRLLLLVDVPRVAAAQRAQAEALTADLDDVEAGGSPGWREAVVRELSVHLATDDTLSEEQREHWRRLADAAAVNR